MLLPAPIVRGRLRGWWWLPTGGGKVWRVLGGTYEPGESAAFARLVRPGDTVFDLGAHTGYYSLLAASLVGPRGRVFAFEPRPDSAWYLRQHARLNRCGNVEVVECAVCDRSGEAEFLAGRGSGTGRLASGGALRVRTVRLDDFVRQCGVAPAAIKVDVEGAEAAVLAGAGEVLRAHRPLLFLSLHSDPARRECELLLARLDYRLAPVEGTAGHLVCVPAERVGSGEVPAPRAAEA